MTNDYLKTAGWTTRQLSDLTGATPRQIRYWARLGLVEASISPVFGRGRKLRYSLRDLLVVLVIMELHSRGLSIQRIRKTVERARDRWGTKHPLAELKVACLAQSLAYMKKGCYLDGLSGQQIFDFALDRIKGRTSTPQVKRGEQMILEAVTRSMNLVKFA